MEWKSSATVDYVLGFEPSNSSVYGRQYHTENNTLHKIAPFGKECINLKLAMLNSETDLNNIIKKRDKLIKKYYGGFKNEKVRN